MPATNSRLQVPSDAAGLRVAFYGAGACHLAFGYIGGFRPRFVLPNPLRACDCFFGFVFPLPPLALILTIPTDVSWA